MKKLYSLLALALLVGLLLSACNEATVNTGKDDDYVYSVGETIEFIDNESGKKLGEITITDVFVLSEEDYEDSVLVDYDDDGDPVYEDVRYDGIVQVCYVSDVIDSSAKFSSSSFKIKDSDGNDGDVDPDTEYEPRSTENQFFVAGVRTIGDGVTVGVRYRSSQQIVAWADANYDGSNADDAVASKEDQASADDFLTGFLITVCAVETLLFIPLLIAVIILAVCLYRAKKKVN